MKRLSIIVAFFVLSLGLVVPQVSFADLYYVCWKKIKRGYKGCISCKGPIRSKNSSIENARTKCPAEQGEDFNSESDAEDWMAKKCDCQ